MVAERTLAGAVIRHTDVIRAAVLAQVAVNVSPLGRNSFEVNGLQVQSLIYAAATLHKKGAPFGDPCASPSTGIMQRSAVDFSVRRIHVNLTQRNQA